MYVKNINAYLRKIDKKYKAGNATEHTHRPALQDLIESFEKNISAVNEPKRIKCGAPDFIVTKGETPLGYIEAKDIEKNLSEVEQSEQMDRYLDSLNNLILTDYLEFRWYVDGQYRMSARLAKPVGKAKLIKEKGGGERVLELLEAFLNEEVKTVAGPKELADRMASLARLIHDIIKKALQDDDKGGSLRGQLDSFRKVLLNELTENQFADMYAQTICYGLFTSRCNFMGGKFTRDAAVKSLPKTNPFLRGLFNYIAGSDLDERISWAVDDLAELLHRAEISEILRTFGKRTRREDPIVHFYETFLASYNPKLREKRGVYYTPEPVVSYIVRSVDHILKNDFKLKDGLADRSKVPKKVGDYHKVMILDPAVGTGTFLHGVVNHIHEHVTRKQAGAWNSYVSQHLLPRVFGFELLMAPYAVAHMKLGLQLAETGYDIDTGDRLRIYLTNTLEEAHDLTGLPLFTQWISNEVNAASEVKQDCPVMVIIGNPPYSGHSANKGKWIQNLIRGKDLYNDKEKTANYFECDGEPLGERNPKWLNDDYVKFIRFAQWRIEQTGYGVLAFISNHGYLDNPTFRGMRQALMNTFDDIYILDLHGNAKKRETCPDGSKDENVFDIQQGVAIGIFVKNPGKRKKKNATVLHAHLYGRRESFEGIKLIGGKYYWLYNNDIKTTEWNKLQPEYPFYLFSPQEKILSKEYYKYWSITEAMPINVLGFQTHRDHFAVGFSLDIMKKRINVFNNSSYSNDQIMEKYGLKNNGEWTVENARKRTLKDKYSKLLQCTYRPFDIRYCYFDTALMDRPRKELIQHVAFRSNICLGVGRQGIAVNDPTWSLVSISKDPVDANIFRRGGINLFPLYLYPEDLFENSGARHANLSGRFISDVNKKQNLKFIPDGKGDLKRTWGPNDILDYMYAVFHSPSYRKRFADFLMIDFPRLPLTTDRGLFRKLCKSGAELVDLHLMNNHGLDSVDFPIAGDNIVKNIRYTDPQKRAPGRVWINETQFFEGVNPHIWEYMIGGYQVCEKWLKDRKGRSLNYDDIEHYRNIVGAIEETVRIQAGIDKVIEKHGGWPLKGSTD